MNEFLMNFALNFHYLRCRLCSLDAATAQNMLNSDKVVSVGVWTKILCFLGLKYAKIRIKFSGLFEPESVS